MTLFNTLIFWIPLVLVSLILLWLFYLEARGKLTARNAGKFIVAIAAIYFLEIVIKVGVVYWKLKKDPFGQFLLPPNSNYFAQFTWNMFQPFVWSSVGAAAAVLVLLALRKALKSAIVDRTDLMLVALTFFVVGVPNMLILILASLLWMVLVQIFYSLKSHKIENNFRLKIAPFLLVSAFLILILNNFAFYQKFLSFLHLT